MSVAVQNTLGNSVARKQHHCSHKAKVLFHITRGWSLKKLFENIVKTVFGLEVFKAGSNPKKKKKKNEE